MGVMNSKPFERGATYYGNTASIHASDWGTSVGLEGLSGWDAPDRQVQTGGTANRLGEYWMIVRNCTGSTLSAGNLVSWQAAQYGFRVGATTSADYQAVAGIVDWRMGSTTVRANDLFFLIVGGRTKALLVNDDTKAATSAGDLVHATATTAGTWSATTAADAMGDKLAVNYIGRTIADTTAADKNTLVWIDVTQLPI